MPAPGHARYEIRVEGALDRRWAAWFEGLQVTSEDAETVISGPLPDQPALHGLLAKVRDLGLCLISVRRLGRGETRPANQSHQKLQNAAPSQSWVLARQGQNS